MTRLPYRGPGDLEGEAHETLLRLEAERGYVPNLYAALANAPRFLPGFVEGGATAREEGALPMRLKEAAILRISALTDSATMRVSHLPIARAAGLGDDEIAGCLERENSVALPPELAATVAFAAELTATVRVTDRTWSAAAAFLDDEQLAELVYICAFYNLVARVLGGLEVELDPRYTS